MSWRYIIHHAFAIAIAIAIAIPSPSPPAGRPCGPPAKSRRRIRPPEHQAAMKPALRFFCFLVCAGLSLLAALVLLLAWLLEKPGAFFRRVSWRLDVAANTVDRWSGPEEE